MTQYLNEHLEQLPAYVAESKPARDAVRAARPIDGPYEDPDADLERITYESASAMSTYLDMAPARYWSAKLADLDDGQKAEDIRRWIADPDGLNLFLVGPAGTGKTYAATAAGAAWVLRSCARQDRTRQARWWSVPSLLDALRPDRGSDPSSWRGATGGHLLVLDDLSHTRVTDWAVERMWMLADARVGAMHRTIVTTNATWPQLVSTWGAATMDRFRDGSAVLAFSGQSRRRPLW